MVLFPAASSGVMKANVLSDFSNFLTKSASNFSKKLTRVIKGTIVLLSFILLSLLFHLFALFCCLLLLVLLHGKLEFPQ